MKIISSSNKVVELINLQPKTEDIQKIVVNGLSKLPKQLPAWFLYDEQGSILFEKICEQPEYKITRTEINLLNYHSKSISNYIGNGIVVEFGAGNAEKVKSIIKVNSNLAYLALDISYEHLRKSLKRLKEDFPNTNCIGICCDHSQLDSLPKHPLINSKKLIGFFPGSSIGNYEYHESVKLLIKFREILKGGRLLIGIDHPKEPSKLESAYNDSCGVSSEFAFNLLKRLNKELGADFNINNFNYKAEWQANESQVEMSLQSKSDHIVSIKGYSWLFKSGEKLITENSIKYSMRQFKNLAREAGWEIIKTWNDQLEKYSLILLDTA